MSSTRPAIPALAFVLLALSILWLPMTTFGESPLVELPTSIGEGEDREVTVLIDKSDLKLATIILRRGTVLPTHSAPVPATIHVIKGRGVLHVGEKPLAVSDGSIIVLEADEPHDVVPEPDSDMLLLVHYLRSGAGQDDSESEHDHGH